MAELALYRKYRPRTFSEIIGQEHVTAPLSQALRSDRLHHAYLFSGPRGCGKTSSARILARSLNCAKGPTPDPCGECDSCRALAPDGAGSIDVIEIDAASHGGVDDARDLRERAFFAPVSSRYKIYVIDEAHMVSSAGFNALLKLVEEPPEYVKFVFATTEPEKVLGTIKSRTHHYPFRLVPPAVLRPYLEQLAVTENVRVEPPVFPLVVRAGAGSVRDSLSVLDQLMAGAGPEGITYARAVALLGVTDVALIDEVVDALAVGDGRAVFTTIDRVADAGHDARRFAGDLLERLRDLIVLQHVPEAVDKGLLDGAEDELARMTDQAQRFGAATLSRMADIVHTGLIDMRGTTAPRLVLELIAARMLLPASDEAASSVLARVERLERRLTLAGGATPATAASESEPPGSMASRGSAAAGGSVAGISPARDLGSETSQVGASSAGASSAGGSSVETSPAGASSIGASADEASPAGIAPAGASMGGSAMAGASAAGASAAAAAGAAAGGRSAVGSTAGDSSAARAAIPGAEGSAAAMASAGLGGSGDRVSGSPLTATGPASVGGGGFDAAPGRNAAAGPGTIDAAAVRRIWDEVLTMVRRKSPKAAAYVREATVRDVDGDVMVLVFKHAFHAEAVSAAPDLLLDALYEVLGGRWKIRCEIAGQPGGGPVITGANRSTPAAAAPAPAGPAAAPAPAAAVPLTSAPTGSAPTGSAPTVPAPVTSAPSAAPAPATPGPSASGRTASASTASTATAAATVVDDDEDWPTPATLGGSGVDGGIPPGSTPEPARSSVPAARRSAPERATTAATAPATAAGKPSASARAAANATAQKVAGGRPGATRAGGTQGPGSAQGQRQGATQGQGGSHSTGGARRAHKTGGDDAWAGSGADEPPWDAEFDPPAPGAAGHVGFDPGDEPADDDSVAGRSTEQAALDLLRDTLGAERIGTDHS